MPKPAPMSSQKVFTKPSKPVTGMVGLPKATFSPGCKMLMVPSPISSSLGLEEIPLGFSMGTPAISPAPTSLKGVSLVPASVVIQAVKKHCIMAAVKAERS